MKSTFFFGCFITICCCFIPSGVDSVGLYANANLQILQDNVLNICVDVRLPAPVLICAASAKFQLTAGLNLVIGGPNLINLYVGIPGTSVQFNQFMSCCNRFGILVARVYVPRVADIGVGVLK